MNTFRKILFPVDFSERCLQSAAYVTDIARKFQSELILLHAFDLHDPFGYGAMSSTAAYGAAIDVLKARRQHRLSDFGGEIFADLPVKRVTEIGEASDCITNYAKEHAIDLITMTTHGGGRFRRLLLGSITAKVLHDTDCLLWTTTHSEASLPPASSNNIRRILCAVELFQDVIRLLHAAQNIATAYGAVVRLVHAIPARDAPVGDMGLERFLFDTATRQIAERQAEAGTDFEVLVEAGDVPSVVRQAAVDFDADLVMNARGRLQEFLGPFRSNAYEIIRESPCPVLSV
jgi:nucleotide-binding universal stress UspA family protein